MPSGARPAATPARPARHRLPLASAGAGPTFDDVIAGAGLSPLRRTALDTLQVNVGKRCNQACHHCHVDAGPRRTESMSAAVVDRVLALLEQSPGVTTVDITGGAPELNPEFRRLVGAARALGRRVIDRCNLTILSEPGHEDLADFLAAHGVEIVASLPCYSAENVDRQRGKGVFERSIDALRRLNALGYGRAGSPLVLGLVYNPLGPSLPPAQAQLEARYREELGRAFGIEFHHLYTITNMPIARFADQLAKGDQLAPYMSLLVAHFNPATVAGVMCRSLLSVAWDGRLHDCDFNQMLGMPAAAAPASVFDLETLDALDGGVIATAAHCLACTAGAGSSCGGALS